MSSGTPTERPAERGALDSRRHASKSGARRWLASRGSVDLKPCTLACRGTLVFAFRAGGRARAGSFRSRTAVAPGSGVGGSSSGPSGRAGIVRANTAPDRLRPAVSLVWGLNARGGSYGETASLRSDAFASFAVRFSCKAGGPPRLGGGASMGRASRFSW